MKIFMFSSIVFSLVALSCTGTPAQSPIQTNLHNKTLDKAVSECRQSIVKLKDAGLDRVKLGLDKSVKQFPPALIQNLINGAKMYRRATPSKYTQDEINAAQFLALASLNDIGTMFKLEGLVQTAPHIEPSSGTIYLKQITYPNPPIDRQGSDITIRDQYDGIPTFGISVGENVATAGFAALGEINTKLENINYVITLKYTAVAKNYILETSAHTDDFKPVKFDISTCQAEPEIQSWLKMPIAQANMNECESGKCIDLPKD